MKNFFFFSIFFFSVLSSQVTIDRHFENLVPFNYVIDFKPHPVNSDKLFIVQQNGEIHEINTQDDVPYRVPWLDLRNYVVFNGEQGLLGLVFHPNYDSNGFLFVSYVTNNSGPLRTVISRFNAVNDIVDLQSETIILEVEQPYTNHNGGQIAFGPDGYLYIALGDGGGGGDPENHAQNLQTLHGSILRIDIESNNESYNYSIPEDNPFVGNQNNYREEIFAYGFRNPWRFSFDSLTGTCWIGDVGQELYEEIDTLISGGNYGWDILEGFHLFEGTWEDTSGLINPVYEYDHSIGRSVTGGFVYRGNLLSSIYGKYVFADFVIGWVKTLEFDLNGNVIVETIGNLDPYSITTFGVDLNQDLYIFTYNGEIYKINENINYDGPTLSPIDVSYSIAEDDSLEVLVSVTTLPDLDYVFSGFSPNENIFFEFENHSDFDHNEHTHSDYNLVITTTPNWYGEANFYVSVVDEFGLADILSSVLIVTPVNDAPIFPGMPDLVVDEDNTLVIQLLATDVDGDYLTYSTEPVEHIDLYIYNNQNLDSLLIVPQPDWNGTANINLTVDDGNGLTNQASFSLTVNPIDDDPFVNGYLEDVYFYEDFLEPWEVNLDEIFTDIDGELTYTAIPSDPTVVGIEVSENILNLFSLENANGQTDIIVTASNPMRSSVSDTLLVTVFSENDPPIINPLDPISFDEDQSYELPSMESLIGNGTIIDIDTDVEDLGFDVFSDDERIYIEWDGNASTNPLAIPDENYNGSGTISICVHDADYTECMDVSVTVNPVNDAPFFTSQMHSPVGINQEFHLEIVVEDVEEQELSLILTEGETNPTWINLTDFTMHGTPDELGTFPVYLTLSDGELNVLDTFYLHVENFMPIITSITDIPNDQGGRVYVSFNASFFDDGIDSDQLYSLFRYDVFNNDSSGWVLVEAGGAIGDLSYTYEATTLIDSTSDVELGLTEFKIVASMGGGIFHSESMIGYSVDNVAPGVPGGLVAIATEDNIRLSWDRNSEEDFQYYILEKSLNPDFSDLEVIELVDTSYTDMSFTANETNFYRLIAVDYAGNHSETSPIVEATIMLSLYDNLIPVEFALHQNYPNPFNSKTQIKYDIPENAFVKISIYDIKGRLIRLLVNTKKSAGYHSINWDTRNDEGKEISAGMYIFYIEAGESFISKRKMIYLK